jgi:hypothetical protein
LNGYKALAVDRARFPSVARTVEPRQHHEKPPLLYASYTSWSGLPMDTSS